MFPATTEVCLRALGILTTTPRGEIVSGSRIADRLGISRTTVTKSLEKLLDSGWIEAVRGRRGGWRLCADPTSVSIRQVVDHMEPEGHWKMCLEEGRPCPEEEACAFHDAWAVFVREVENILDSKTMADLDGFVPPCFHPRCDHNINAC
ncbi:MAG: Rrf2 family transcriptional regulator [Planctomycetota bacterium]